jgi:hypothetical protein
MGKSTGILPRTVQCGNPGNPSPDIASPVIFLLGGRDLRIKDLFNSPADAFAGKIDS